MKSIAIEREFGSGGREVGIMVSRQADIPFYDGNLLVQAAKNYGISIDLLNEYDENKTGSLLFDLALSVSMNHYEDQTRVNEMYYGIQETIQKLAKKGPSVFVGRCSTEILKDTRDVVSVFIYSSDDEKRLERVMIKEGVSELQAKRLMWRKDRQREKYYKFWTDKSWKDKSNYDLALDTSKMTMKECADRILQIAQS